MDTATTSTMWDGDLCSFYLYMLPSLGESDDEVFIRERVKNSRHPFDAKRKLVV
jgi:hypothetical protein